MAKPLPRKNPSDRSDLLHIWFALTVSLQKKKKAPLFNKDSKEGRFSSKIIQMSLHHSQSVLNIYADFGEHPTTFRPLIPPKNFIQNKLLRSLLDQY